jgi:hypothetical protein
MVVEGAGLENMGLPFIEHASELPRRPQVPQWTVRKPFGMLSNIQDRRHGKYTEDPAVEACLCQVPAEDISSDGDADPKQRCAGIQPVHVLNNLAELIDAVNVRNIPRPSVPSRRTGSV